VCLFSGGVLGVAAKLERRRVLERTARGRADAKAKGIKFGRKPILTLHQQASRCPLADEYNLTGRQQPSSP
jgi:DNA invertase Pin-like site-specific DNA recombinase